MMLPGMYPPLGIKELKDDEVSFAQIEHHGGEV